MRHRIEHTGRLSDAAALDKYGNVGDAVFFSVLRSRDADSMKHLVLNNVAVVLDRVRAGDKERAAVSEVAKDEALEDIDQDGFT